MPFFDSEMFPLVPSALDSVWLGPTENSFSKRGVKDATKLSDRFHPGCCWMQPPGKLIEDEQAKIPNGPGRCAASERRVGSAC